ncbi:hypothetical protein SAMN04515647_4698 [Cohaesibacter sp. ES.047]|uniref:cell division protein FtsL n=1 Tax=Cohaesibacter sp. ES.047 TaxID=1798205 RepID=UPI000BB874E9|nr:hypothetical protein [Cohaesibacter sp. ES.047]SNY94379.1 hypothetical protein SAMN04515647_4698 [Cohaesibacter sp. ES.047]
MSRLVNVVLFVFVLVGAFWLYQVKHEAKLEEEKIATLQKQIKEEKQALLLLKAEWSYLNRPQRVQTLTDRFSDELGLKQVEPYQIGKVADLPERVEGSTVSDQDQKQLKSLLNQAQPASLKSE